MPRLLLLLLLGTAYDARNYHHIDRNFGPDPAGDEAATAAAA